MKVSVLVIAHNEEQHIGKCLEYLLTQTTPPDEIILIAHNCTDRTEEIARRFPTVRLVSYQGPAGSIYARIKGFESVTGEIIVCTDGDSFPDTHWVEEMIRPFSEQGVVAVHGFVLLTGAVAATGASYNNFHVSSFLRFFIPNLRNTNFWGASFALRLHDYRKIGTLTPLITLREKLDLREWADDYYLYLALRTVGKIVLTYKTTVKVVSKQKNLGVIKRSMTAHRDADQLRKYFEDRIK